MVKLTRVRVKIDLLYVQHHGQNTITSKNQQTRMSTTKQQIVGSLNITKNEKKKVTAVLDTGCACISEDSLCNELKDVLLNSVDALFTNGANVSSATGYLITSHLHPHVGHNATMSFLHLLRS